MLNSECIWKKFQIKLVRLDGFAIGLDRPKMFGHILSTVNEYDIWIFQLIQFMNLASMKARINQFLRVI